MFSLASKVFAVSGGASGMGLATYRMLAAAKAKAISIDDFQDANFEAIRKELQSINPSTEVQTVKVDVSSSASVTAWISSTISSFGTLDGAVNAAGVAQLVSVRKSPAILSETDEMFKRAMEMNLEGVFYCPRERIRVMMELPKFWGVLPTLLVSRHWFMEVIRMVMVCRRLAWRICRRLGKGCCTA
jgi:chanoclavine-I dehydrogenase